MDSAELLADAFSRVDQTVATAVADLSAQQLAYRPDADANSISWLVWHLTRVQDDHVAEITGRDQEWVTGGWNKRFGTDSDPSNTGYGHTSAEVAAVIPDEVGVLGEYHGAAFHRTLEYLRGVGATELDRIIDRSYDPPISVGVRLVSVINDNMQHAGQARYLRGMVERR